MKKVLAFFAKPESLEKKEIISIKKKNGETIYQFEHVHNCKNKELQLAVNNHIHYFNKEGLYSLCRLIY